MRHAVSRNAMRNMCLALAFLGILQAGLFFLFSMNISAATSAEVRAGRAALERQDYNSALGHFKAALDARPDSGVSAHGAACASWLLGDGPRAAVFQQMATWAGYDFEFSGNCFGSVTPYRLFRTLSIPPTVLLYRRAVADDPVAEQAVNRAERLVDDPAHAAVLIACVNWRGDLRDLARLDLAYANRHIGTEQQSRNLRAEYDSCIN